MTKITEATKNSPVSLSMRVVLLLASSMTVMAGATIAPSLPQINQVFSEVENAALLTKLVLTIPGLFIAICAPIAGWLVDTFGRKNLLLGGLLLYGFAGASGFFLDNLYLIIVGRMFLGMAVAAIMTTSTTLIADYFSDEKARNAFMGMQGAFMAIGGIVFIMLGGWLADINWRYPFLIYLTSWFVLPAALWILYEPHLSSKNLSEKEDPQKEEKLSAESKKWVAINYITAFVGITFFYMVPVQIPFLLKEIAEVSNAQVGQAISTGMLAGALMAFNYQRIRARFNFTQIYIFIFLLMATGYFLVSQSTAYWHILGSLFVSGLGFGMMMPNTNLCLMKVAPPAMRGRIIGGVSSFVFIGQFASPLATAPIIDFTGSLSATFQVVCFFLVAVAAFFGYLNFADRKASEK